MSTEIRNHDIQIIKHSKNQNKNPRGKKVLKNQLSLCI